MAGKVQVVVNPALRRFTDRVALDLDGRDETVMFDHDTPVALTEAEYDEAAARKVVYDGTEVQLVVKATPAKAAKAEKAGKRSKGKADDESDDEAAQAAEGGHDK